MLTPDNSNLPWHASISQLIWMVTPTEARHVNIDGLVQDRSVSSALVIEILHSCTEPSVDKNKSHDQIQEREMSSMKRIQCKIFL